MLEKIDKPEDLKNLTKEEKQVLAKDIRELIIDTVSQTGGHLASNLGAVELTIALCSVYNFPDDKIIFDVGHQSYVYKILTQRKNQFQTLRKLDGIAGFPKTQESEYDSFNTGHSSTSISAALGMARARDLLGKQNKVIALIGDGALTGGMATEALNDAGSSKTNITVVLNDNEMSISKNVGGLSSMLSKLRTKKWYTKSNNKIKDITNKIPYIGKPIVKLASKIKRGIKQLFIQNMYFEDLGFTYLGPVDGHDIEKLEDIMRLSNDLNGPVLIHVITKKGKGYEPAEQMPDKFHSISQFDKKTGEKLKKSSKDYSKTFGDKLIELAKKDEKIVAITAAMKDGTGLSGFAKEFPNRFFDVGIAEQHALTMVAGMASSGLKPVIPLYSSFVQRGYDQLIHDICIQNLPVVLCVDRAGCVGNDGETHQGLFDLSFLSIVPNLTILAPKDFKEFEQMLEFALNYGKPIAIRYPRGGEEFNFELNTDIKLGKAEIIKEGTDITIVSIGKMVARAHEIAQLLQKENINAEVINSRFLKPFDDETIINSIEKTKNVITIEDNIIEGALGSKVTEIVNKNFENINVKKFGYPDEFIKHGSVNEIEKIYGLDTNSVIKNIKDEILIVK